MASSGSKSAAPLSTRTRLAQLTNLAKKYGHPYKKIKGMSHRILKNTGKSGITPLTPFFAISPTRDPGRQEQKYKLYFYQQHRYQGFTAAELHTMESLSGLDMDTSLITRSLTNPIHAMFAKRQWDTEASLPRHLPLIPLFTGEDGFWQVDNPIVWKILDGPLKLASQLLDNASLLRLSNNFNMWDALFNGNFSPVKAGRLPPEYSHMTAYQFFARPPDVSATSQAAVQLKQDILAVHDEIKFGFFSGYTWPITHLPRKRDKYAFGMTGGAVYEDFIKVWISVEILKPLLRDDLGGPEQLTNQFRVACTIIHECAHAVWDRLSYKHPNMQPDEPYFENEPLSEIGWSLEDKLWGGYGVDIIGPEMSQGQGGLPNLGIYSSKWFTDAHHDHQVNIPTLDHHFQVPDDQMNADPYYWIDHWPVPMTWTSMMFNPDAWSALLRPFRSEATQMGPLIEGTRRLAHFPESYGFTEERWNFDNSDRPIDISMTDAEKARWVIENGRRTQSRRIMFTLSTATSQSLSRSAHPDYRRHGSIDAWDSASDTEDEEQDEEAPKCPRWNEFKQYLFRNRGPNELAWDSMSFDIPEWTLYRYILARGGLAITPIEWHDFLVFADHSNELFQYGSKPWSGTVKRIAAGWPTTSSPHPPMLSWTPKPSAISTFEKVMNWAPFQKKFYSIFRGFGDIDYGDLLKFVNRLVKDESQLTLGDIFDVVDHWARLGRYVTWGPYRIARTILDIPQSIKDQFPPLESTGSQGSQSQGSEGYQSQGSRGSQNQGSEGGSGGHGAQSQAGQASQPQPPPKSQEEIDLENFEKEAQNLGLDLDLNDLEIFSSSIDDSGFVP